MIETIGHPQAGMFSEKGLALLVVLVASIAVVQASHGALVDLTKAIIVAPRDLAKPEQKAVRMLVEEVEKRTQICWARSERRRS